MRFSFLWVPALLVCLTSPGSEVNPGAGTLTLSTGPTHLLGGERVERAVIGRAPNAQGPFVLKWQVVASTVVIAEGSGGVELNLRGDFEKSLEWSVPPVSSGVPIDLFLELTGPSGQACFDRFELQAYPANQDLPEWSFLDGKRIGVFGLSPRMKDVLSQTPARIEPLLLLDSMTDFNGDLLLIGEEALKKSPGLDSLERLLVTGKIAVPTLVLRGDRAPPDGSADPESIIRNACVTAEGHPVLMGLSERDLLGWRGDGSIGRFPLPIPPSANHCQVLRPESGNHAQGGLLTERFLVSGETVLDCALPLLERWGEEPVCPILFSNLLRYLTSRPPGGMDRGVALYGSTDDTLLVELARAIRGEKADWEPTDSPLLTIEPGYSVTVMPGKADLLSEIQDSHEGFLESLAVEIREGGTALILGVEPESLGLLQPLVGEIAALPGSATQGIRVAKPSAPLLWGISESDWREVFATPSPQGSGPPRRLWIEDARRTATLIEPGLLVSRRLGKGTLLVLQAGWGTPSQETLAFVLRQLLVNLGVRFPEAAPDQEG